MTNSLIIDTSINDNFIAIYKKNKKFVKYLPAIHDKSSIIIPTIEALLNTSELKLKNLNYIFVSNGPGSFIGTRTGIITAKSISFILKIPIIKFCSLKSFIPKNNGKFATIIKANHHLFHIIKGEKTEKKTIFTSDVDKISLDGIHPLLDQLDTIISNDLPELTKSFNIESPQKNIDHLHKNTLITNL